MLASTKAPAPAKGVVAHGLYAASPVEVGRRVIKVSDL